MTFVRNENSTAVFFPGEIDYLSGTIETRQLKQTLVYFDHVLTLVPEAAFTGDNWIPRFGARSQRVEQFLTETSNLRENGLLTCLNPTENIYPPGMKTHFYGLGASKVAITELQDFGDNIGELLFTSIVSDLEDEIFRTLVDQLGIEPFPLYTGQLEINWFSMLANTGHKRDMWDNPQEDSSYGGFCAMVSPQLGAATLLNHALITSIRYGAIPIANNAQFNRLLQRKFERINLLPQVEEIIKNLKQQSRWRTDFLAKKVLDLSLPDFDLETYEEVLDLREKLSDQLENFRNRLIETSSRIRECEVDEVYSISQELAQNQIIPAISEIEKKLRLSNDKFLLRVVKGLRSAKSSVPLIGTAFTGLPLWLGIVLSAGATIAEAALETYFEKRELRENNGLTFLLGFRQ